MSGENLINAFIREQGRCSGRGRRVDIYVCKNVGCFCSHDLREFLEKHAPGIEISMDNAASLHLLEDGRILVQREGEGSLAPITAGKAEGGEHADIQ